MKSFKQLTIAGFYLDRDVSFNIKDSFYFVDKTTEDNSLILYPVTNDDSKFVVVYYRNLEVAGIELFPRGIPIQELKTAINVGIKKYIHIVE